MLIESKTSVGVSRKKKDTFDDDVDDFEDAEDDEDEGWWGKIEDSALYCGHNHLICINRSSIVNHGCKVDQNTGETFLNFFYVRTIKAQNAQELRSY